MSDDVTKLLERLGLAQYADAFEEGAIDWDVLPSLDHEILKELGVSPPGHRLRILGAIEAALGNETTAEVPPLTGTPAVEPVSGEAERRQLTVMFCDLAGSTKLSQEFDPEELREINRAYQDVCTAAIERYEGYVARYMGDGVLAYFGYPRAHEDDAERAVHAGLGIVESLDELNASMGAQYGIELGVRIGIATGPVVVGDLIGEGASQENAVVGETPNVAARLQALATTNTVVIGPGTHDLTTGRFDFEDLGAHSLKGIAESVHVWRVIAPVAAGSRFEATHRISLTPLVGREHEIGLLMDRWGQAKEKDGQVALLAGEAGIGKSRIAETLRERTADDGPVRLRYQCSPYHTNTALYPVLEQLERAAQFGSEDTNEVKLVKLEALLARAISNPEAVAPLLAPLLSISAEGRYPPLEMTPERQKERTLQSLAAHMEGLSRHQPVLVIFEDVHWADPTTLQLLELIIERAQSIPVFVVITHRPEFSPPWSGHTHVTSLTLNRFTRRLAATIVSNITGRKRLPDEVLDEIVLKTDGVPLFVEELTRSILDSGQLTEEADAYVLSGPLTDLTIPATLHDSLIARLDRLGAVKETAQSAAVIGREFDHDLLAAVSRLSFSALDDALEQLVDAGLVFRQSRAAKTSFVFKHALVRDAAYGSMLRATRQELHGRIADVLLSRFPEKTEAQPELLAHHYTEAARTAEAVTYWLQAGRRATERSANQEAVRHLAKGLTILQTQPPSIERDGEELALRTTLYTPLVAIKGYASEEVRKICARVRELCELTGKSDELFPALYGQWAHYFVGGNITASQGSAEELLELAERFQEEPAVVQGHRLLGWTILTLGDLPQACIHINEAVNRYDPEMRRSLAFRYGHNPYVAALTALATYQWLSGYPERAWQTRMEALDHGRELKHAASLSYGLTFAGAQLAAIAHNPDAALESANECITLGHEQGIASFLAWNEVTAGWATARLDRLEEGEAQLRQGIESLARSGQGVFQSLYFTLLAEVCLETGDLPAAKNTLTTTLGLITENGERWYEAEVVRLLGEVHVRLNKPAEGEELFHRAIQVAQELGEKSLELRAAISLAGLWKRQGKHNQGHGLLAPVYNWFTEGFETANLVEARTLLGDLC